MSVFQGRRPTAMLVSGGVLACLAFGADAAAGQAVAQLAEICTGDSQLRGPWCRAGALAYQAAASGLGLTAARGAEIPGTASTLGRRLGATPRIAASIMLTGTSIPLPEVVGSTSAPVPSGRSFVPGISIGIAGGLIDGFRVAPGVGGIGSVDLVGDLDLMWPPGSDGFTGGGSAVGLGVRIGLVRESFTLPGVSISVMRRFFSEAGLGVPTTPGSSGPPPGGPGARSTASVGATLAAQDAPPIALSFDMAATSVRLLTGKDLVAVGLMAGVGWDRYGGDLTLEVEPPGGESGGAQGSDVTMSRWLGFVGGSWTYLILQVTGELGWALGLDDVPVGTPGPFDPGSGSFFGTLSARLTI